MSIYHLSAAGSCGSWCNALIIVGGYNGTSAACIGTRAARLHRCSLLHSSQYGCTLHNANIYKPAIVCPNQGAIPSCWLIHWFYWLLLNSAASDANLQSLCCCERFNQKSCEKTQKSCIKKDALMQLSFPVGISDVITSKIHTTTWGTGLWCRDFLLWERISELGIISELGELCYKNMKRWPVSWIPKLQG